MLFKILNINEKLKDALSILKFVETTEIQSKTLPLLLSNKNAIIVSETGSGKTLCYLLPLFNHILENKNHCAIIITPTKELCRQIYSQILTFKQHIMELHPKLIIGGESSSNLTKNNFLNTNIIVATPNKVYELLKNKLIPVNFNEIILDEADMLFDLGFMNDINNIFTMLNKNIIKVACSATLHDAFANKLKKFFLNTEIIQNAKSIWKNNNVTHTVVYTKDYDANKTLKNLLGNIKPYLCIIFGNTKNIANDIYKAMVEANYNVALIHKDLTNHERRKIFKEINSYTYQYVVATDLISRGVDLPYADLVISYGLPDDALWYIHRSGRVGRNKKGGDSFIVYCKNDDNKIAKLIKKGIKINYSLVTQNEFISKPLQLRLRKKIVFDKETNSEIQKVIRNNKSTKRVKPCYKKKIKSQILKIKQKKKHEHIDKIIKAKFREKLRDKAKNKQ